MRVNHARNRAVQSGTSRTAERVFLSSILSVSSADFSSKSNTTHNPLGINALEQIRRMRGGTQAHLMRCSDGYYYVVKFQNNPQGSRVLANEFICFHLAAWLGMPVAAGAVVVVDKILIDLTPDLRIELPGCWKPCRSGRCFGSRFPGDPHSTTLFDTLTPSRLHNCRNAEAFLGMLVFDIWTSNIDNRQAVFLRRNGTSYGAIMIDHGLCFGGSAWELTDQPRAALHMDKSVYESARGLEQFEPWLSRLEEDIDEGILMGAASEVPEEWYNGDTASIHRLLEQLHRRRHSVRMRIIALANATPAVFTNWVYSHI